ncbi:MAG: hypothetical protein GY778_29950 [bacterium]|nr:hypothetical protein [bacterium]
MTAINFQSPLQDSWVAAVRQALSSESEPQGTTTNVGEHATSPEPVPASEEVSRTFDYILTNYGDAMRRLAD